MVLSASRPASGSHPVEQCKPGLLLFSDGVNRFVGLLSMLRREGVAVKHIERIEDLGRVKLEEFALAILDLDPAELLPVLRRLRSGAGLESLSVLVSSTRLPDNWRMAALLRRFRAMPCAPDDLLALVRQRLVGNKRQRRRKLL